MTPKRTRGPNLHPSKPRTGSFYDRLSTLEVDGVIYIETSETEIDSVRARVLAPGRYPGVMRDWRFTSRKYTAVGEGDVKLLLRVQRVQ